MQTTVHKHKGKQADAVQLLRIETEGAYAALVAGSPSADAQDDAIRSASFVTHCRCYISRNNKPTSIFWRLAD